jgi:hypothetical protein
LPPPPFHPPPSPPVVARARGVSAWRRRIDVSFPPPGFFARRHPRPTLPMAPPSSLVARWLPSRAAHTHVSGARSLSRAPLLALSGDGARGGPAARLSTAVDGVVLGDEDGRSRGAHGGPRSVARTPRERSSTTHRSHRSHRSHRGHRRHRSHRSRCRKHTWSCLPWRDVTGLGTWTWRPGAEVPRQQLGSDDDGRGCGCAIGRRPGTRRTSSGPAARTLVLAGFS